MFVGLDLRTTNIEAIVTVQFLQASGLKATRNSSTREQLFLAPLFLPSIYRVICKLPRAGRGARGDITLSCIMFLVPLQYSTLDNQSLQPIA
jgi:hypothetical protein